MLTRFVRIQLIIFTIASIIGMSRDGLRYMQVPTLLGIGRMTVKLELPDAGGLYRFGNVTYRGVQVGKVTAVALTRRGAEATLSLGHLAEDPGRPASRGAQRVSGRRTVCRPAPAHRLAALPARRLGHPRRTPRFPQPVGPAAGSGQRAGRQHPQRQDRQPARRVVQRLQRGRLRFRFAARLVVQIADDLNGVADHTRTLIDDSGPLLDSQAQTTDAIRPLGAQPRRDHRQVATDDPEVRSLLRRGPGFADEVSGLLDQLKPTLPVLLANLTTIGQIAVTYNASLGRRWSCCRR